jgi:hypothetical protein
MPMKILFALVICACSTAAAAQGMYKCKDAAGKITYAGNECHLLGLTPAGEVKGKANVAPAVRAPAPRPAEPIVLPPSDAAANAPAPDPAPEADVQKADRRCFVVKTGKGGTATRCNDTPDKDEKAD